MVDRRERGEEKGKGAIDDGIIVLFYLNIVLFLLILLDVLCSV